jgi:two-component system, sensor histidine kinase and response regulator
VTSLRVLVVGSAYPIAERLQDGGHTVTPVDECEGAIDALQLQSFDAVVLGPDIDPLNLTAFAERVQELNRQSSFRTAMFGVAGESLPHQAAAGLDGYLPGQATPEALSTVLVTLSAKLRTAEYCDARLAELSILDVHALKEQVAFDDELLVELIDLYCEERKRQSSEMQQALGSGEFAALSRLAHTIKGSLGNLHSPSARAEAQLLESAALLGDRPSCEQILPGFEHKLNLLETELQALKESLTATR